MGEYFKNFTGRLKLLHHKIDSISTDFRDTMDATALIEIDVGVAMQLRCDSKARIASLFSNNFHIQHWPKNEATNSFCQILTDVQNFSLEDSLVNLR